MCNGYSLMYKFCEQILLPRYSNNLSHNFSIYFYYYSNGTWPLYDSAHITKCLLARSRLITYVNVKVMRFSARGSSGIIKAKCNTVGTLEYLIKFTSYGLIEMNGTIRHVTSV